MINTQKLRSFDGYMHRSSISDFNLLRECADHIDAQTAEIARLSVENDGLNAQADRHTAYTILHRGAALYCTSAVWDAYSDEHVRANAAEAEIARLREALFWNAAALNECCKDCVQEASNITIESETKCFSEILDMADAALAQEQGDSDGNQD